MSETTTLIQLRTDLADVLAPTGAKVTTFVPERLVPPSITVEPGEPYMASGDAYSTFQVNYAVTLVVEAASNEVETTNLDDLIAHATSLLDESGWGITQVGAPVLFEYNDARFLGVVIDVNTTARIERGDDG